MTIASIYDILIGEELSQFTRDLYKSVQIWHIGKRLYEHTMGWWTMFYSSGFANIESDAYNGVSP